MIAKTNKRFFITLSLEEFELLATLASKQHLTPSHFATDIVKKQLRGTTSIAPLAEKISQALETIEPNKDFIITDLFSPDEWMSFSRSDKTTAATLLFNLVKKNPNIVWTKINNINHYRKEH